MSGRCTVTCSSAARPMGDAATNTSAPLSMPSIARARREVRAPCTDPVVTKPSPRASDRSSSSSSSSFAVSASSSRRSNARASPLIVCTWRNSSSISAVRTIRGEGPTRSRHRRSRSRAASMNCTNTCPPPATSRRIAAIRRACSSSCVWTTCSSCLFSLTSVARSITRSMTPSLTTGRISSSRGTVLPSRRSVASRGASCPNSSQSASGTSNAIATHSSNACASRSPSLAPR